MSTPTTTGEKLVYVCRRCKHCAERHVTPRINGMLNHHRRRANWVCMVHAKPMTDDPKAALSSIVPCASRDRRGTLHLKDFEMREDE